jgi:4-amino-4-deoxy-L-arabinose transferase-like glycosyltransferase
MYNERRILLALFSIAFGIRVLYAALVGIGAAGGPAAITAEAGYGFKIAEGTDWITKPLSPRAPGYPVFLGIIVRVFGKHIWPALIAQALLGGFLTVVLYRLGKLLGGRAVGLLSAFWIALFVHHIYFSSLLVHDVLSCFILTALVLVLARPFTRMRFSLLAGALYAYLAHIDPQFLLLLPVFAAFLLFLLSRYLVLNLQYLFLFLSTIIVVSAPWTARNYYVYKQFVPVSLEANRYIHPIRQKLPAQIREMTRGEIPEISKSRISRMKENATEFWRVTNLGSHTDGENVSDENVRNAWSLRHNIISIANYGVLLPFFILGVVSVFIRRNRAGILAGTTALAYFAVRLFFGGNETVRLQIEPLIIVLSFYAIIEIVEIIRRKPEKPGLEVDS